MGKAGDWLCPNCGDLVFASRVECKMCGTSRATWGKLVEGGKPGDWNCTVCANLNFSYRTNCKQCGAPAEDAQRHNMKPGDWICPNCNDLVFHWKDKCKMCGTEKPEGSGKGEQKVEIYEKVSSAPWRQPTSSRPIGQNPSHSVSVHR